MAPGNIIVSHACALVSLGSCKQSPTCHALELGANGLVTLRVAKYFRLDKLDCLVPTGEFSLDDSKRLCVLTLEKALKQLPEGQDTVLGIFDLRGFKQKNGDLGFAAFLVSGISIAMPVYNNCI